MLGGGVSIVDVKVIGLVSVSGSETGQGELHKLPLLKQLSMASGYTMFAMGQLKRYVIKCGLDPDPDLL